MRVLVGTVEIAGGLLDWADGFRKLGHEVTTVIRMRNPLYTAHQYDIDLTWSAPWPRSIADSQLPLIRVPRGAVNRIVRAVRLIQLIATHDLFVFLWGGISLTNQNREFHLLKRLGKRIVSIFCGSDVRHAQSFLKQYRELELDLEFAQEVNRRMKNTLRPLSATRFGERFSDVILSQPNQSNLAIRPYMHYFIPIKLAKYTCSIPRRDVPVVIHAPSSRDIKGTGPILQALDRLRNEGVRFELRLLNGVPNEEVVAALVDADVVIDQLYSGGYGKLGLETMASGCALATRAYDVFWPFSPDQPIWHVESSNLYHQLKRLLSDKGLRIQLANDGRKYVERYHDHVKVAESVLELLSQEPVHGYDYYPTYFARHFCLDDGEAIPPKLQKMTTEIARRWGLPEDVDPGDMVSRGLMSADGSDLSKFIPRWKSIERPRDDALAV